MKTWIVGGLIAAGAVGVYVTSGARVAPAPTPAPPASPAPVTPAHVPATLPVVVNVADIDHLLDPPSIPVADTDESFVPVLVTVAADHSPAPRASAPVVLPRAAD